MDRNNIVIIGSKRTAIGKMQGMYTGVPATRLGAVAIQGALQHNQIKPEHINEVIMGCVLSAGQGQAPARQAALSAGLSEHVPATTLNKMCGSGMQAVIMAHHQLQTQSNKIILAGGQENMTRAPYLLTDARQGYRMGHHQVYDHMFLDGLQDAYENQLMGVYADATAKKFKISRQQQDNFALESVTRALKAPHSAEISAVTLTHPKKGIQTYSQDECPRAAKPDKMPQLKPAFNKDGSVTAANASSIADGAAVLALTTLDQAEQQGYTPLARIVATTTHAQAPAWFTTAPITAIEKVLQYCAWNINDVDLFEINEAFAVVSLVAMQQLKIPHEKINIYGGACALGHPIGASGARIIVTLLNALTQTQQQRGVAALCIGGGEATAIAIERIT